jgi:hypothetical protein
MRTRVLLTVLFYVVPGLLFAQSTFTMTAQNFNEQSRVWTDTFEVSQFWKSAPDRLDSVHSIFPGQYLILSYDWHTSASLEPARDIMGIGEFRQLGRTKKQPANSTYYDLSNEDTFLISLHTTTFDQGRVVGQSSYQPADNYRSISTYGYTKFGELERLQYTDVFDGTEQPRFEVSVLRQYDSANRVINASRWMRDRNGLQRQDSQSFKYSDENSLITAQRVIGDFIIRYEFYGWQDFESDPYPFNLSLNDQSSADLLVCGGNRFLNCSYYLDGPGLTFHFDHRQQKQYDSFDRLVSDTVIDTLNQFSHYSYVYYPNGDLRSQSRASDKRPNPVTLISYENEYNSDGSLHVSIYSESDQPKYRYIFSYPTSEVSDFSPTLTSPSFSGDKFYLPVSGDYHHVTITDLLGVEVLDMPIVASFLNLSLLRRGLYFISIDGGKPRKHLIP